MDCNILKHKRQKGRNYWPEIKNLAMYNTTRKITFSIDNNVTIDNESEIVQAFKIHFDSIYRENINNISDQQFWN